MDHGLFTFRADNGRPQLQPTGAGGMFVELVTFSHTDPSQKVRRTFTNLPGFSGLFCALISGGCHDWNTGRDGSGYLYIEASGFSPPANPNGGAWPSGTWDTVIGVFAR
ncbi:MAG: hypothetical protein EOP02_10760 [Proteobacteria bacterium]|nr:MAG: hypothetical protein EOP02_10760 [Pseudomonadota bacterium]